MLARMPRPIHALVTATAMAALHGGCSGHDANDATASPGAAPSGPCLPCGEPRSQGSLLNRAIDETSGLAVSAAHPDVVYAHNDSGDGPRFFAMTRTGGPLATFHVDGAEAIDWEDIALGPCPAGTCLYLGDTGDNQTKRGSYAIYRVTEPKSTSPAEQRVSAEVIRFRYPDGEHNAEALLVHPLTGTVTIVTKVSSGKSPIYELPSPLDPGQEAVAIHAGSVKPPRGTTRITDGAIHPRGLGVLLRTYTHLFYYPMRPDQTAAQALAGTPCKMPVADERQGEAVAWLPSGAGYITVSEGEQASIFRVECRP